MKSILIVDDSATSRAIAMRLIGEGYSLHAAANGQEALEAIDRLNPDLLLIDLLMPVMDGPTALSILHKRESAPPAIVMTADIQESTKRRLEELGIVGIVYKPLTREKLLPVIEAALEREHPEAP